MYVQAEKNFKEHIDCKTVGFFFLKMSNEIGKGWRKSLWLSVLSVVPYLLFDCSRVLEYAKIPTVLQSKEYNKNIQTKTTSYNQKVIQLIKSASTGTPSSGVRIIVA